MLRTILVAFLAAFFFEETVAQSYAVRNYSIAEGLPSTEVYDVFQDSKGFIWFGTDNGVVRFDGREMTVFRSHDGLEDPVVFGIMEDRHQRIWFRTFSGRLFTCENQKIVPTSTMIFSRRLVQNRICHRCSSTAWIVFGLRQVP
ncbi:MAG TPA: two-component regulator propeller domain-containing protein [Chryseosolibacter sp.]|nr:two-component regulator propeller domain-containing protein [Chryseosolibacter sp.]